MVEISHIDAAGNPTMVDVGAKALSARRAIAHARVEFPCEIGAQLLSAGFIGKKGAILHTAIIAGVMAAKRTHELIPFCHALSLEHCEIRITPDSGGNLDIECECSLSAKTGVEMEAMTGASIAALTIYDMTKALSLDIQIRQVHLLQKSGGKRTHNKSRESDTANKSRESDTANNVSST
jgi:cyclic pyranopterin phosphate synthase